MQNNISNNIFLTKEHIQKQFINSFGYNPDIDNPTTFNEKLQWLKLYYKNPLLTLCADKYKVRDYVKKIIGKKYLTNLLGVYNNENKINFNKLPNKFILKINHGSGQNIICKNKLKLNEKDVKNKLKEWIKSSSNHYYFSYEWGYKNIKPKIICEEYLGDNLLDYKIFCFSGKPICIGVDVGRFTNHRRNFYDLNWNYLNIEKFAYPKDDSFNIPKPPNLNEMLVVAKKLSSKFPFVRVDLYSTKGKTYFGEMTFYPGAGLDPFKPVEWDYEFGEMIKLPKKLTKDQLNLQKWLIEKEIRYGGIATNVPRNKVSPFDTRTREEINTGGDRMLYHGYAEKYAEYLSPIIKAKKLPVFVETGILKGSGLAVWCDLFEKGRIICLDKDLNHIKNNIKNLKKLSAFLKNQPELYEFDQSVDNKNYLEKILKGDKIDIVIDDGFHSDESILNTMKSILPHLSKNFIYFIEDNSKISKKLKLVYPSLKVDSKNELTIVSTNKIKHRIQKIKKKKTKVVYTCVTGNYDEIINHKYINDDWNYVCFTDNIPKDKNKFIWKFRSLKFDKLNDVRNSRWHKLHPHILFPEYNESLYVDANIDILNNRIFQDIKRADIARQLMSIGPHPERHNIYDEFDACEFLKKDNIKTIEKQKSIIKNSGFSGSFGTFFETNIVYRKHNNKKIIKIMSDWWYWIKNYSYRDQLSLVYVLWKNNFKIKALTNNAYRNNKSSINFVSDERHASKKQLIIQIRNLQLNIIDNIIDKDKQIEWKENKIKSKDDLIANQNKTLEAFNKLNNTFLGKLNWAVHNPKKFIKKYFEKINWAIHNPKKFLVKYLSFAVQKEKIN